MLARWDLLDYCFARYLNTDLTDALHTRSWAWFKRCVSGLMSDDTLLAHQFKTTQQDTTEGEPA